MTIPIREIHTNVVPLIHFYGLKNSRDKIAGAKCVIGHLY